MGSYDTVRYHCPNCHAPQTRQTKAGTCELKTYPSSCVPLSIAGAMLGAYETCTECKVDIQFETTRHHVGVIPLVKPTLAREGD